MNNDFITKAKNYKKFIASRYIAIEAETITSKLVQFKQFLVSLKYDGHFYALAYENKKATLINRNGKILERIHFHEEIEKLLQSKGVKKLFVAGELCAQGEERTRQFNVSTAITAGGDDLRFAAFDIMELEDDFYKDKTVFEKYDTLKEIFPSTGNIHVAEHFTTESKTEIEEYFKKKVTIGGQEGLVVKNEGFSAYKVKPKFTFDAVIVGFASSDGDRSDLLRDFLLAFRKDDGTYQIFAHMSHGFSDDQRRELLAEYKKKVVKSDYLEIARNRLGFQMVKPETVVEFSCIDVINQDSKGDILKMNLSYDEKNGYSANYKQPTVSVTIPLFIKFREDKKASIEDVNFKQILEIISYDNLDNKERQEDLPKTSILKREVYTKVSRGSTMIRKFVILKTNKEAYENYPAYVFHFTDFSSGRKDPLKKDVKVTNSKEQVFEIWQEYVEKNIKKGWEIAVE